MKVYFEVLGHCLWSSVRHPRTTITQSANPLPIIQSPIPWWGSIGILIIGILSWIASAAWDIHGLDEAARALVYIPLGNIFGMSLNVTNKVK